MMWWEETFPHETYSLLKKTETYFMRAQKVRHLVVNGVVNAFHSGVNVLLSPPRWGRKTVLGIHQIQQDVQCPEWYFHTRCVYGRLASSEYPEDPLKPRFLTGWPASWMCVLWPATSDSCQVVWKTGIISCYSTPRPHGWWMAHRFLKTES